MSLYPQRESLAWSEQRDDLKKRLADSEADNIVRDIQCCFSIIHKLICHQVTSNKVVLVFLLFLQRLLAKLTNKEKEASKLAEHLDFEKVKNYN